MQNYKSIYRFIVPVLIILLIFNYRTELLPMVAALLQTLKNVKLKYVIIAVALYLLSVYIFAERWKIVLNSLGYDLKTTQLFPVIFGAIPINNITPANRAGGEPLRMLWVKKDFGVKYSDAFISILFERSVEAIPVLVMMVYVIYTILPFIQNILPLLSNMAYLVAIPFVLAFLAYMLRHKIGNYIENSKKYCYKLKTVFFPTLILSSSVWVLDIFRFKFITLSLDLQLPFKVIVLISLLYMILGSIPLTAGGLGVVEGGLIAALSFFGISMATAAGIVAIERFISYILASLIGSIFLVQFGGLKFWKNSRSHS
jgi:uncharacterized membrane protein YbhN (UPF0104 family)